MGTNERIVSCSLVDSRPIRTKKDQKKHLNTSREIRRESNNDLYGWIIWLFGRNRPKTVRRLAALLIVHTRPPFSKLSTDLTVHNVWSIHLDKSTMDFSRNDSFLNKKIDYTSHITLWITSDGGDDSARWLVIVIMKTSHRRRFQRTETILVLICSLRHTISHSSANILKKISYNSGRTCIFTFQMSLVINDS